MMTVRWENGPTASPLQRDDFASFRPGKKETNRVKVIVEVVALLYHTKPLYTVYLDNHERRGKCR